MDAHREGVWTGHDALPCRTEKDWRRYRLEGVGLVGFSVALTFLAAPSGLAAPVGAVVLGFGAFGLMGRHADHRKRQGQAPVQELREEFGVGPVWKVELMVRQGEAPTGCDRGLLWIEGGRIVFAGLRTSFALVPSQVKGGVRHDAGIQGQRLRLNLSLTKQSAVGPVSLSFWPIAEGFKRADSDASDLRYALNRALNYGEASPPETTGQWPPLGIGPHAPTPQKLLGRALLPHAGGTAFAALLGLMGWGFSPGMGALVFGAAAIGTNLAVRTGNVDRWQAWRDARIAWRQP